MWAGVIDFVEGARTIAISGHTNPDGDALGSVLGLGASIRAQFPDKRVDFLLADDGSIPRIYRFLPLPGSWSPLFGMRRRTTCSSRSTFPLSSVLRIPLRWLSGLAVAW